ncbi:MAG: hypothetical protein JSW11_09925 [Candidatus Heimdallarchaeota archaeon]|nr:MAG: hypothetical protein JSW11_09925 [Candidatus Heimdallarchaeota archaeon]
MKFNKKGILVLLLIFFGIIYLITGFGSNNTPYQRQKEYDEVNLADDPTVKTPNPFIFEFPSIDIPSIGGIFGLGSTGVGIILIIFGIMIFLVIMSLIISRSKKKEEIEDVKELATSKDIELKIRRLTLGKRIEEIISFLEECLDSRFSQGITEGFEQLDLALKEYSKISRPGWLTPREFTFLKIPYFNHEAMIAAVEQFYRITYGLKPATRTELEEFIEYFKSMIVDKAILKWKADLPLEGIK